MSSSTPSAPSSSAQKLSIYPDPPRETLLLDTPSALEQHIGTVRRTATAHLRAAHAEVQGVVSRWIGVENRVEHRIKALLPPDERLTPGVLYVGVAILTGAILARHRGLPTRIVLPPVLGLGAATHFLPKLSSNVRAYVSDLEDEYTPGLAHVHETGKAHTAMGWERLKESGRGASESVKSGVGRVVEALQASTGLKIQEALGVARQIEKNAEQAVEEKVRDVVSSGEEKKV
ncbi:MICOS complex subunit [Mycena chlorophos]|uniref:MICOS complex subunit n=1 Tax=Mycena chlorophos TaxID=658473 RepID=A0A8H6TPX5_MYCCL|nr:MICOS complex subunit [Mycena chlorophos]